MSKKAEVIEYPFRISFTLPLISVIYLLYLLSISSLQILSLPLSIFHLNSSFRNSITLSPLFVYLHPNLVQIQHAIWLIAWPFEAAKWRRATTIYKPMAQPSAVTISRAVASSQQWICSKWFVHPLQKISLNYSYSSSTVRSTINCLLGLCGSSVCSCRVASWCSLCRCFTCCLHQLCCTLCHCSCCFFSATATGYFRQSTLGLLQPLQCRLCTTTSGTLACHAHWPGSSTSFLWLSCCTKIWSACASTSHSSRLRSSLLLLVIETYLILIDNYGIFVVNLS